MKIYAIADLHLSLSSNKPMDIFGDTWHDHEKKIKINWQNTVDVNDYVLIPGDISWAINLEQARKDLEFLNNLNGIKILIRGNHDYWWPSKTKFEKFLKEESLYSIRFIHNNFLDIGAYLICGSRGWDFSSKIFTDDFISSDEKIFKRELVRLENSLKLAREYNKNKEIIVMLHFPPYNSDDTDNEVLTILRNHRIKNVIFGHIHGDKIAEFLKIKIKFMNFYLVSVDAINFLPIRII